MIVEWQTATDANTVAFALYRRENGSGSAVRVPSRLLPALGTDPAGGRYRYRDTGAAPDRTYAYELEQRAMDGTRRRVGCATVQVLHVSGRGQTPPASPGPPFRNIAGYTVRPHATAPERAAGTPATTAGIGAVAANAGQPARLKIKVRQRGLHHVSATDIADRLGLSAQDVTNRIANQEFRISSTGSRRAYVAEDDGSGLSFYHAGFESDFANDNVFWLENGSGWVVPPAADGIPTVPAPASQSFRETRHFEEDKYYSTQEGEWLWIYMTPGIGGGGVTNEVALPGVAPTGADAGVSLRFIALSVGEHRLTLSLNGQQIGLWEWSSSTWQTPTFTFDHTLLNDGTNHLALIGEPLGGAEIVAMMVDSYTFTYSRRYEAVDGRLPASAAGHSVVTVRGFTNSNVCVVDVSNAHWPRRVVDTLVEGSNGNHTVSFRPRAPDGCFVASEQQAFYSPVELVPRGYAQLRSGTNAADHVIITRTDMLAAANRLAQHRRSNGWQSVVVDVEDVYDAFNWGIEAPVALTRFLEHADNHWHVQPTHVVLGGTAAFDYRNLKGVPKNVIPTVMARTPFGFFSSDNRLADFRDDDSVPEVAIGRLPAITAQELSDMVDKIISYELQAEDGWETNTLWIADNPDAGGDFDADSDTVAAELPGKYSARKLYLYTASSPDPTPPYYRKSALVPLMESAWNAGQALVNYRGHGNWNVWAEESLLDLPTARSLSNGSALPLAVVPSCQINWHEHSLMRCIGEELLLNTQGGAVAVWAPSGRSINAYATEIDRQFMLARYAKGHATVGGAVQEALRAYSEQAGGRFTIDNFILLADPAIRLK